MGFEGPVLTDRLAMLIRQGLGGVIYFSRNIENKSALRRLSGELGAQVPRDGPPLLIAVDQEGGRVRRLKPPEFIGLPSARELTHLYRQDRPAFSALLSAAAREMRQVGITLDFAPILDVDTHSENPIIGDRAFSRDPEEVAEVGIAAMQALHREGVLSCGKHFPGHGDTDLDSHKALPVLNHDIDRLEAVEWLPFRRAILAGLPTIMTAHILFPGLDPTSPATLSAPILEGVLRKRLGFEGVIVTDDLGMKGVRDHCDLLSAAVRSLAAGADLLLICEDFAEQEAAMHAVDRAIVDDVLPREKVEASLARIARLKIRV